MVDGLGDVLLDDVLSEDDEELLSVLELEPSLEPDPDPDVEDVLFEDDADDRLSVL